MSSRAREVSHLTVEEMGKALGVKPGRVVEFEGGEALPTFRQLTLMAAKLDRPLGFFFVPPPTEPDVPETADFRGRGSDEVPPDLAREMRRAERYRDAMLDLAPILARRIPERAITWQTVGLRAAELLLDEYYRTGGVA